MVFNMKTNRNYFTILSAAVLLGMGTMCSTAFGQATGSDPSIYQTPTEPQPADTTNPGTTGQDQSDTTTTTTPPMSETYPTTSYSETTTEQSSSGFNVGLLGLLGLVGLFGLGRRRETYEDARTTTYKPA
jgi:MYXO-CTERM domain-containing protein